MITILTGVITVAIFLLITYVALWIIEKILPIPERIKNLILVLVLLIALLYVFTGHRLLTF
jgi:hypothetical protein